MIRFFGFYVVASALMLTSCGGGGSDSGSSIPISPTPTVTPTPAPTETPAPTFTYASFDLSRDGVFAGQAASASTVERYTSDLSPFYSIETQQAALETNRGVLELSYSANKSLTIRFGREVTIFTAADVQTSVPEGIIWRRARSAHVRGDAATFGRISNFQYIYAFTQEISEDAREPNAAAAYRDTTRYFLVGERTREGDAPTVGTSTYYSLLTTTRVGRNRGAGFGAFADPRIIIDHATGSINARLTATQAEYITGTMPEAATLVLTGTVTSAGVNGTITSPDSSYTGTFTGDLFGPRGLEVGLVLTLNGADGVHAAGRLLGHRG